uniref:Immunoglobulin domain-containing protein n=1 Tax=Cyprinus carpio TaxID=7962 RepID=A0A8C2BUR2_CYPCA
MFVMKGDSVTLHNNVETDQQEKIIWYFYSQVDQDQWSFRTRIAEISGNLSFICTDVQCNNGTERFKNRLKLDHQTGSLTITSIRDEHEGIYILKSISISGTTFQKDITVRLLVDMLCVKEVSVSVKEGDYVTLHTDVKMNQQENITWLFKSIRIAKMTRNLSFICTDVQCNEGTERFRDRLKLDHQTGSLAIRDIRTTDSGFYDLQFDKPCGNGKLFFIDVLGVSAAERDEMKIKSVKEGESVTLDPGEININNLMTWYFNDTLIAEITGDQNKICTDVQCEDTDERFRGRLEVNNQTGSLTITNIDTTDSGLYKLQISSRSSSFSISSFKSFGVIVTAVPDSGLSSAAVAGICAAAVAAVLLLLVAAVAAVIYHHNHQAKRNDIRKQSNDQVRYYEY